MNMPAPNNNVANNAPNYDDNLVEINKYLTQRLSDADAFTAAIMEDNCEIHKEIAKLQGQLKTAQEEAASWKQQVVNLQKEA